MKPKVYRYFKWHQIRYLDWNDTICGSELAMIRQHEGMGVSANVDVEVHLYAPKSDPLILSRNTKGCHAI
jgi:hypothetical protein